eukprot:5255494-Pyramimonas_sp.AAC.1
MAVCRARGENGQPSLWFLFCNLLGATTITERPLAIYGNSAHAKSTVTAASGMLAYPSARWDVSS